MSFLASIFLKFKRQSRVAKHASRDEKLGSLRINLRPLKHLGLKAQMFEMNYLPAHRLPAAVSRYTGSAFDSARFTAFRSG